MLLENDPPRLWLLALAFLAIPLLGQPPRTAPAPDLGANLPAQKIGKNDLIAVSVYDCPELTRTVRVSADGMMRLPMLKRRLKAEGLLPNELETVIAEALRTDEILVDPLVTVTIVEYHSHPISVMGAVKRPLTFQADSPVTLLDALARAEGLAPDAGREILVTRTQPGPDGKPVALTQRILVKGLIDAADSDLNVVLNGGEEVRVPEVGKIFVVGNVKKPGAFPVQGAGDTTVLQMIALAEGLMPYAGKQAFIYRREANGSKNEIPIELKKLIARKSPDVPLTANDILYIPDRAGTRASMSVLEKVLAFGAGTATAGIYAGIR